MQIHVNRSCSFGQKIRIFSKSNRDSTQDWYLSHKIILDSLSHKVQNCILEGELMSFNEMTQKIEMFPELRECGCYKEDMLLFDEPL